MKLHKIIAFVLIALSVASCSDSNDDTSGVGDAIIISKKQGDDVLYGYALYAYTFGSFKGVTAVSTADASKTYTLKMNQEYKSNFYYEPPISDFKAIRPVAQTFNFRAVFENGEPDQFEDELTDKVLPIPEIEKTEYNSTDKKLGVTWKSVSGADSYGITIMDVLDGSKVVYGSTELANTLKYYEISSSSSGWISGFTPDAGKTYTIRLNAYLYEPSGNSYNMQAVSIAEKSIVWGN